VGCYARRRPGSADVRCPSTTGRLASLVAEGATRGGALGVVVSLAATPHNNALQPTGPGSILLPRVEAGVRRGACVLWPVPAAECERYAD